MRRYVEDGYVKTNGEGWTVWYKVGDVQHTEICAGPAVLRLSEVSSLVSALMQAADMPNFHDVGYAKGRASRDPEIKALWDDCCVKDHHIAELERLLSNFFRGTP